MIKLITRVVLNITGILILVAFILLVLALSLGLSSKASAVDVALCERGHYPGETCEEYELTLGDVKEGETIELHAYVLVGENETWTDNTCAVRVTGSTGTTTEWFAINHSTASGGWFAKTEDTTDYSNAPSNVNYAHTLWVMDSDNFPLAFEQADRFWPMHHASEFTHLTPFSTSFDCNGERALSYTIDYELSGASHWKVGDPSVYFCGGLDYTEDLTEADVLSVNLDITPLDSVTDIEMNYIPDYDQDGVANTDDNCGRTVNPNQVDTNSDGYGNMCDADYDNNGAVGMSDWGALNAALGCSAAIGRCAEPGWAGPLCTFDPDNCTRGVCSICYDEDIDMDSDGGIGVKELGLLSSQYGKLLSSMGLVCD